ncbi:MAG TPA: hypothetical protein PLU91_13640 [Verrucomicrobiota bacterium]|jgi:type IV pilus assembly protein PilQ|nr:hypothetical protein [Verrucomicrobiota bacterium]
MKRLLLALTLVGIVACSTAGFAQTTSPTGDAAAPAASAAPATDAAPPAAEAPAPDATANSAPAVETPPPASIEVAANEAPAPAPAAAPDAASAPQSGTVIPLIVMDDVPLTDAIRNLARQAGINHQLDPKIGFGQLGPDGKMTPQPNVSIRWENITAEQALNALLGNYELQIVEDTKSKIARVTTKDPAALPPLLTKIYQLKYASPSNVLATVQASIDPKRSKAMPDIRTSQLVVVATEQELVAVDELIELLDKITRQVLIEARILETTVNPKTMKGIDWAGTLEAQQVTLGNNGFDRQQGGGSAPDAPIERGTSPIPGAILDNPTKLLMNATKGSFFNPSMAFLNADGVSAVISFLNTHSEVREISAPRSVTLDNEKAMVEVGMLYPIVNVSAGTANTTGGSQITYSNLTIRLEVTPRISANDYVNLTVNPSITKLGPSFTSTIAGVPNEVDSFLTRNLTTHVMIPSGNTLVMGGLIQDQINTENVKVPILGDIPVLGYLFRHDSKDRNKTDLVLFITPTIIQDEDYQPTRADFLKRPVPQKDSLDEDWSAWDSGLPKSEIKKRAALPAP